MSKKVITRNFGIFYNQTAGNKVAFAQAKSVQARLEAVGLNCNLMSASTVGDVLVALKEQIKQYDAVVVIGGDGTLNQVIQAMVQIDEFVPIGLIPSGTNNHFANNWQLSTDIETACRTIITGFKKKVSFMRINHDFVAHSQLTLGNDPAKIVKKFKNIEQFKGLRQFIAWLQYFKKNKSETLIYEGSNFSKADVKVNWFEVRPYTSDSQRKYRDFQSNQLSLAYLNGHILLQYLSVMRYQQTKLLTNIVKINSIAGSLNEQLIINPINSVQWSIDGEIGPKGMLEIMLVKDRLEIFISPGNRVQQFK